MKPEQFEQVLEAILDGKYSWACVLLLRFSGYNPLHYIPYRTHNRLLKENEQIGRPSIQEKNPLKTSKQCCETRIACRSSQKSLSQINDLGYFEVIGKQQTQVRGGDLDQWLDCKIREYYCLPVELGLSKQQCFSFGK